MLVDGIWQGHWNDSAVRGEDGEYLRPLSSVRNWITQDGQPGPTGTGGFTPEPGRYHLYIAHTCPWANRTMLARQLLGLEAYFTYSVVSPVLNDDGWNFDPSFAGADADTLNHCANVHSLYTLHDKTFTGRATVPVLWDKKQQCIVNNESADILRMMNQAFRQQVNSRHDLYPLALQNTIDQLNTLFFDKLNNGVYQAGFAPTQAIYEAAYDGVFAALDDAERRLSDQAFIAGDQLTETDIRLFVTLIRFDLVYASLFKCNRQRIRDFPHLFEYLKRLYNDFDFKRTVDVNHIKHGYYSIKVVNPYGTVPKGPDLRYLDDA